MSSSAASGMVEYSLTKLMVSHDLLRSTVTNQIAFDQRDSKSVSIFERAMDRCCHAVVCKLETLEPITFTYLNSDHISR